ncbi:hypothetical protein QBC40DRAFT_18430 [Triangularia verruculosa]|uniref:Cell wall proline rich protein n=1 Tax=Triangularia verruculosa TaxID=2587418 RepID=A0AAN6X8K5_9PEZI|nr:hypothetical protein QBC40DRAFT_18430 [Triangularia verruculosa]
MATTFGSDMMVDAPAADGLDQLTMLRLADSTNPDAMGPQDVYSSSSQTSPGSIPPPPNPPFVFPARPSSSSASAPSTFSRATGRRPRSAIEPHIAGLALSKEVDNSKPRTPALPNFSFNPGASLPSTLSPESAYLSPAQSPSAPSSPRTAATRPGGHGHRRGGSEFVGGKLRDGEAITITNVSPTKPESGMASPMLQPTRPRRGHAHRRSAAISSHDLASIILPPANHNLKGGSAPASPAFPNRPNGQELPAAEPSPKPEPTIGSTSQAPTDSGDVCMTDAERISKPPARNRVGFSDTLEYIPRPLSLVSSDASSTATARPGHSVSGSISSLISLTTGERDFNTPSAFGGPAAKLGDSRPSTAGAVLENTLTAQEEDPSLSSPRRRGSIPFLGAIPPVLPLSPATPSPTRSAKKWNFFGREGRDSQATGSPVRYQSNSPLASSSHVNSPGPERISAEQCVDDMAREPDLVFNTMKPLTKKRSKKQKKVKTWAGTILSRKSKYRYGKQKRRTPTPPPPRFLEEVDALEQDTAHVSADAQPAVPIFTVTESPDTGDFQSWTFPKPVSVPDEDMSYQMIDLDAALGPFNTPLPRNLEWEAAQRAGGNVKKQLHSAAGMSRFTGPGMHYHHRRAESAPEMVPFEGGRLGFRRFGSSSTMADVFEEDEEEEEEYSDSGKSSAGQSTPLVETTVVGKSDGSAVAAEEKASADISQETPAGRVSQDGEQRKAFLTVVPAPDYMIGSSANDTVDVLPGVAPGTPRSSSSIHGGYSGSTTPSPRHISRPKDLAPVEVGPLDLPPSSLPPVSPFSLSQSSAFPSPRTPMSYDAHRISTAPSSITEDNFQSLLLGEPGPEVRISVDDIPSLTSSNSTMTRESLFPQHPQARNPPLHDLPRPASFTSTAFGRRRSSLASLSRLISSSHGERSKLSMEVPLDSEPEQKAKVSKTKRLSRMVKFWKPKENETA